MKKAFLKTLGTGMFLMNMGSIALAANPIDPRTWIPEGGTDKPIESIVVTVLNWLLGLGALSAVVVLIVAGIMYITAAGDEAKIGKATKTLTFAIIGLVVVFIAVVLVNFVLKNFLNVAEI